jgi:Lactate racemase N-terminal domain
MRVVLDYGREHIELEAAGDGRVVRRRAPQPLANPAEAVRNALRMPYDFPALRLALTADDHVTVVVDQSLPGLPQLLLPVLEDLAVAGVDLGNVTLLCEPSASRPLGLADLPKEYENVRLEIHDPKDRKKLSYLATTKGGRRLYLARSVVDADQLVVLSARRFDPRIGRGGAGGAVFPGLGDEAARSELDDRPNLEDAYSAADEEAEALAVETAWLLGAPFFIEVIEAAGDGVAHVTAGTAAISAESRRQLDAFWRWEVPALADIVVATLSGDPSRQTFADLAAAAACAACFVQPDGRIVLLSQTPPGLTSESALLLQADDAQSALDRLHGRPTVEQIPAWRWAGAASRARLFLLSAFEDQTVEDLFATPLQNAGQVQRLLASGGSCLFLDDAHRARPVVKD